ncbi:MAG: LacI family DNA-binding transcriptional regulator, partial [Clostridia bacterium]|nr:LacI family DNA-binding transcriptional regulator [Clostridia bacterium]
MITISKIAKLANVSVSTASKAFSGSTEVSEITRDRIFNVAKKLGVFKKFYNAKYPKIVIAVVVPEYLSGNYGVLISELQRFLNERDCTVTVTAANFLLDKNETLIDYYAN